MTKKNKARDFEWLKCDKRTAEAVSWEKWFRDIPPMRSEFRAAFENEDPLLFNETASVGLIAAAAVRSGMLALAEYVSIKRTTLDQQWSDNSCRCDLWVYNPATKWSWSFEFKQIFCRPGTWKKTLKDRLDLARQDAGRVCTSEADRRFAVLLAVAPEEGEEGTACVANIRALASEVTFACRIGGSGVPVYLLLQRVKRRPRLKAAG